MKKKHIERECKTHGVTDFVLEGSGYYRCKKCRSANVAAARRRTKIRAVDLAGGKCIRCGYNKSMNALHFHHPNSNKEFSISRAGGIVSWARIKAELEKCILVCANCHAELHEEIV
jgi:Zn finger protein HypA/HybF involved in hydrogenase expression